MLAAAKYTSLHPCRQATKSSCAAHQRSNQNTVSCTHTVFRAFEKWQVSFGIDLAKQQTLLTAPNVVVRQEKNSSSRTICLNIKVTKLKAFFF